MSEAVQAVSVKQVSTIVEVLWKLALPTKPQSSRSFIESPYEFTGTSKRKSQSDDTYPSGSNYYDVYHVTTGIWDVAVFEWIEG